MDSTSWVYLGPWTNWADGAIQGAKLTVYEVHSAYLIAFLALFVRLAGQHSWDIFCFLLFRLKQSSSVKDYLHQGQQTILRNTLTDTSALWQFLHLGWRQRRTKGQNWRRSLGLIIFSALHLAAFTVAGIFVSQVTDGSSQVLLRGPICGIWKDPAVWDQYLNGTPADGLENNRFATWIAQTTLQASRFAASCYNTTSSTSALANCAAFGPGLVTWNITTDIECPFDSQMCKNGSVRLDSGLLDSQLDFGINTSPKDRVKYRRVVECAPIAQEGFVTPLLDYNQVRLPAPQNIAFGITFSADWLYQEFNYGPNIQYDMNSTFIWSNATIGTRLGNFPGGAYYSDVEIATFQNPDSSTFSPIDEVNRTDADVVMYFLLNAADYLEPVYDPWFESTIIYTTYDPETVLNASDTTNPFYTPNNNVSVMSCAQQFQYCNHDGSKCSELTGSSKGGAALEAMYGFQTGLDLNPKQKSIQERLWQASWLADMYYANYIPADQNLLASAYSIDSSFSAGLPDNQWILEMQHFFLLGLTSMQIQLSSYATGPPGSYNFPYVTQPAADERWMCDTQIVQRAGYATFSMLGIALILILGGLIIVVNLFLTNSATAIAHASQNFERSMEPHSEWDKHHNLSLLYSEPKILAPYKEPTPDDLTPVTTASAVNLSREKRGLDVDNSELSYHNDFSRNIDGTTSQKPASRRHKLGAMLMSRVRRAQTSNMTIT